MAFFTPKRYQRDALDAIVEFFQDLKLRSTADEAFAKATLTLHGKSLGYNPLPQFERDMPYFCLRIPVGGGKTFVAAKAVSLVNNYLLQNEYSVILWLTPSNAIRDQTLSALKANGQPLNSALREAGPITVMSLDEAKSLTRPTLDTSTVVIVATRQSFQVEKEDSRKVYEDNSDLVHHFDNIPPNVKDNLLREDGEDGEIPFSLVNVLRMRRPFIIVDEAHNNRTELSFDTLARFNPSGILELTATPDTQKTPSNVLFSVSAAELKAEEMIKLPIVLQTIPDWRECLAQAIAQRDMLQTEADKEWKPGDTRKRPVALIQAEPKSSTQETCHADIIRDELVKNQRIPEEEIVIATGDKKGLDELKKKYPLGLSDPACPVKYVITQKALAEGWDYPWAYVLASVAQIKSSTAVEQLLGRILRQPDARKRASQLLNQSYAFVTSRSFTETADTLKDQLVNVAGFEKKDASQFVVAGGSGQNDQRSLFDETIIIEVSPEMSVKPVPPLIASKVKWDEQKHSLVITEKLDERELRLAKMIVEDKAAHKRIEEAVKKMPPQKEAIRTPAEKGEIFTVPQFSLLKLIDGVQKREPFFDPQGQLPIEIKFAPQDVIPDADALHALSVGEGALGGLDVNADGQIVQTFQKHLQLSLDYAYMPENWNEEQLSAWLCRRINTNWLAHKHKIAFVSAWLGNLLQAAGFGLGRAVRQKSIIRNVLERKLDQLYRKAANNAFQTALFGQDTRKNFIVDASYSFTFDPLNYYPASLYDQKKGKYQFQKHFYKIIGDFDSSEEFDCARYLDQLAVAGKIKFWVRNLVKTDNSFYLFKADGKFYPDFVCSLPDGRILVVEYKGADKWDTPKVKSDRAIGELWAELTDGKCGFVMVKDKDWRKIDEAVALTDKS